PVERSGGVVAARVDGKRPPEAADAGRLVDVPMKAKQRLDVGEDIAYRLAACRRELHLAKHLDHAKVLVQHRSIVQPTRDGRYVDVEDGPRLILQPRCEGAQRGTEPLLRLLALAVPGRRV